MRRSGLKNSLACIAMLFGITIGCSKDDNEIGVVSDLVGTWKGQYTFDGCTTDYIWTFVFTEQTTLDLVANSKVTCHDVDFGSTNENIDAISTAGQNRVEFPMDIEHQRFTVKGQLLSEKRLSVSMSGDSTGRYFILDKQ